MKNFLTWFFIFLFICTCICGGKTECSKKAKISILLNLQTNVCEEVYRNPNVFQESDNFLIQKFNQTYDKFNVETVYFDTCGSNTGTLKAIFKTIVWADINCLHPPYFLGFIGPDNADNLNVAMKITSALKLPHIVGIPASAQSHYLLLTENQLLLEGIFKLIDVLGWKSFTLKNDLDDSYKPIVKQFMKEAEERKLCIKSSDDASSYIIYFGKWDAELFKRMQNSSIIIISEENIGNKIKNVNSNNSFLILDNIDLNDPTSDHSNKQLKWWIQNHMKLHEDSNEIFLIQDAIKIYLKSLSLTCPNKNCHIDDDLDEWNSLIIQSLDSYKYGNDSERKKYTFKIKEKNRDTKFLGKIIVTKNDELIYWNDQMLSPGIDLHSKPLSALKNFISNNETNSNCIKDVNAIDNTKSEDAHNYKSTPIEITEMTDSEWWTMVGTVTGVGIAMFAVGFFAVYIVYTNIRGPRSSKSIGRQDSDRDGSIRRVGSDRKPASGGRNSRAMSNLQRRDSRSSVRSNISDKSV